MLFHKSAHILDQCDRVLDWIRNILLVLRQRMQIANYSLDTLELLKTNDWFHSTPNCKRICLQIEFFELCRVVWDKFECHNLYLTDETSTSIKFNYVVLYNTIHSFSFLCLNHGCWPLTFVWLLLFSCGGRGDYLYLRGRDLDSSLPGLWAFFRSKQDLIHCLDTSS